MVPLGKEFGVVTLITLQFDINCVHDAQGLGRGCSAQEVLQALVSQLRLFGALCTLSVPTFSTSVCYQIHPLVNIHVEVSET